MYWYYQSLYWIDTFGLLEGNDVSTIIIQCEQYVGSFAVLPLIYVEVFLMAKLV
jgi:hypothetical protein